MTLEERYRKSEIKELIKILDTKECYTNECVAVVQKEYESRAIIEGSVEIIAESIIRDKFREFLEKFDPYSSTIKVFESTFLTKEQIIKIQKDEFDKWLDKREGFEFDVWNYAIGAIG